MPKITVGNSGSTFGSNATNQTQAVIFTASKRPDGNADKDTRT